MGPPLPSPRARVSPKRIVPSRALPASVPHPSASKALWLILVCRDAKGAAKPAWAQDGHPGGQSPGVRCPSPSPVAAPWHPGCAGHPEAVVAVRAARLCPLRLPVCARARAGEPGAEGTVTPPGTSISNRKRENKGGYASLLAPSKHTACWKRRNPAGSHGSARCLESRLGFYSASVSGYYLLMINKRLGHGK